MDGTPVRGLGGPLAVPSIILSPNTRRRQRGRGVIVLDNVTAASTMTNATVLTPGRIEYRSFFYP